MPPQDNESKYISCQQKQQALFELLSRQQAGEGRWMEMPPLLVISITEKGKEVASWVCRADVNTWSSVSVFPRGQEPEAHIWLGTLLQQKLPLDGSDDLLYISCVCLRVRY